jgi:hypothetical protein
MMKKKQPLQGDIPEDEVRRMMENKPLSRPASSYQPAKKGFLASMWTPKKDEYEETVDIMPSAKEDDKPSPEVIEALKISGKWLSRLDADAKKEFRESQDYQKYRSLLQKWGLTKK